MDQTIEKFLLEDRLKESLKVHQWLLVVVCLESGFLLRPEISATFERSVNHYAIDAYASFSNFHLSVLTRTAKSASGDDSRMLFAAEVAMILTMLMHH